ncbi:MULTISPECIES: PKD domain-containing protein [Vibrio]|uniref:PKD domain-containing protein n=2 Tax=Vibrionaceae TaxID=641 RepID=UPI00040357C7|nr:PKD domain-containing protein [Vibrio harveyi]
MKPNMKWTLLAITIPSLIACGGGSDSNTADSHKAPVSVVSGYETAKVGNRIRVDGLGSYGVDASIATYTWSISKKPQGSNVKLNNVNAISPYFTPDVAGDYTVQLVTNDGKKDSSAQSLTITATEVNTNVAPVIYASETYTAALDQTLKLDAKAYDADNDMLSYQWALNSAPKNTTMSLSNASTKQAALKANVAGEYKLTLTVSDGKEETTKEITINYSADNVAPVAMAGRDTTFELGGTATLDASASIDGNDSGITYQWEFVSKPSASTAELSDATSAKPTFTPDVEGDYALALTVSDGALSSGKDFVRVTASKAGTSDLVLHFNGEKKQWPLEIPIITLNKDLKGEAPKYVLLGSLTLEAVGQDYEVQQVFAMNATNPDHDLKLSGIEDGSVLPVGDEIVVKFWSAPTQGSSVMMTYGLMIKDQTNFYGGVGYHFQTN